VNQVNKNFNAKKYFIYGFKGYIKNDHKFLSKVHTPSIRELLMDYVEIHEDITTNLELEKLENARKELLDAMKYHLKSSILYESSFYNKELILLIKQIDNLSGKVKKEKIIHYSHIYNLCNALIKKINSNNIYMHIVNLVKGYNNFRESEKAIHLMVNELLFEGYSLSFLESWFREKVSKVEMNKENIDGILDEFCKLKKSNESFCYYITVAENEYFTKNTLNIDFNLSLIKQDYSALNLIDSTSREDIKSFLQVTEGYNICEIKINSMDYFKGLNQILNSIQSYFQMIDYVTEEGKKPKKLFLEKIVCRLPDDTYIKLRIGGDSYIPTDTKILFSKVENRERQDVEDFLVYRDKLFSQNIRSQEVFNIQRALNIVKTQLTQSQENKVINLWAVLEYVLTFKESGSSIISKVKDIVPKVVCLYIMKDKINVFWNRVYEQRGKSAPIIEEFLECKKEGEDYHYDLSKLITFIEKKGPDLIQELSFNDNLKREISEIGQFIAQPKRLYEYLKEKEEEIKHDLVRIYRTRNVLIHSGKEMRFNLECKALRLYSYNNNLLGLIIYYMCKNPQVKITEILNSIDYTYEHYIKELKEETLSQEEICKPKYLFIG